MTDFSKILVTDQARIEAMHKLIEKLSEDVTERLERLEAQQSADATNYAQECPSWLLRYGQAAKLLSCSRDLVKKHAESGKLQCVDIRAAGAQRAMPRVTRDSVLALLREQEEEKRLY